MVEVINYKTYLDAIEAVKARKDECAIPQWTYDIVITCIKKLYDGTFNSSIWLLDMIVPYLEIDRECLDKLDNKTLLFVLKALTKSKLLVAREKLKQARDKRKELKRKIFILEHGFDPAQHAAKV